jgi:hypothetical protein
MAYLLERDPLNVEGGKIVFEGREIAKVENVHVEVDNREELKLDDLKLPELGKIDHDKLSATGTVEMTPEMNDWLKNMKAMAIVET